MRRALLVLVLALGLSSSAFAQEEAPVEESGYAFDSVALSTGLSVGSYALAGAAGFAFLGINRQCDDAGEAGSIFCDTFVLPFVGVAGAAALGAAALAPSAAHFSEGDTLHARITTGIRLAGAASVALGVREVGRNDGQLNRNAAALVVGGGVTLLGLGVYDMIDAGFARDRVAKKKARVASVSVAPAPVASASGTGFGLFASGSF
jgi:hypothetical protein